MTRTLIIVIKGLQTKLLFATRYDIKEYDLDTGSVNDVTNIEAVNSIDYDSNGFVYCSSIRQNSIRRYANLTYEIVMLNV